MGEAYPELISKQEEIIDSLRKEEEQFARTLDKGMAVLEGALKELSGKVLPGELIFQLYDTFGFPTDLTNDVAREGYSLDMNGYEKCMEEQRSAPAPPVSLVLTIPTAFAWMATPSSAVTAVCQTMPLLLPSI